MNEQDELDPATASSQETESASSTDEADTSIAEEMEVEAIQSEEAAEEMEAESSPDDLLEDVRHSIIMETAEKEEQDKTKWWKRIGRGSKRRKESKSQPLEVPDEPVEIPVVETTTPVSEQVEYVEQLDELIEMLEDATPVNTGEVSAPPEDEVSAVKEEVVPAVVDFDELKKRAFHSRTTSEPEEVERSLSEVRSVALDEGEDVFVEVEAKTEDPFRDRMKAIENALMPYRRYLNFIFVFVSLVMVVIVSASLYRLYLQSLPPPPVEDVSLLPYPVGMNLPGGLKFTLGKGKLVDGRWDPRGPEWLEGTEICRWIAIPYSRQLEAVVRTLTKEDQIELVMSNNDVLAYTVDSIDQLSIEDMQKLGSDSPCMLMVLAQAGTDERWVVTAIP